MPRCGPGIFTRDPLPANRPHMPTRKPLVLLFAAALLASCGGDTPQETLNTGTGDSTQLALRQKKTKSIFYNIPSPMETATLLKEAGAEYDKDILNDVLNVDKYTAASKQALNLGIYGADLSYASVFNNTQESMFYTSCAKKLADRLGVSSAFNDSTISLMEENRNDRDKLLDIVSETYWNVDAYLKDNGREDISGLMIAGGWIEGLYIATQVTKTNDSPKLRERIAEQKLSLGDLTELLSTYGDGEPALTAARDDLAGIKLLFDGVALGTNATTAPAKDGAVTVIGGGGPPPMLTDEQLKAITEKATAIRSNWIN